MTVDELSPCREILGLARELALPAEVQTALEEAAPRLPEDIASLCRGLTAPPPAPAKWEAAVRRCDALAPNGMAVLALYLAAAGLTRRNYRSHGVPDQVFLATMGCFSRFLAESRASCGHFAFDRAGWSWRQLSCRLFRLGALEFEYAVPDPGRRLPPGLEAGAPVLFVHIPSDARLTGDALAEAYRQAAAFFGGAGAFVCADGSPRAMLCESWLLSPSLRQLLPENSGIRRFAAGYELYAVDPQDPSFYRWLFQGRRPPQLLPCQTSLQRTVAEHLARGGAIGSACGVLRPIPA